jgi:hypothetical protein
MGKNITYGRFTMDKKTSLTEEIEDTLACSAFAEAGEPCPTNIEEGVHAAGQKSAAKKGSTLETVKNTLACSAFAEEGEPCPIDTDKKTG